MKKLIGLMLLLALVCAAAAALGAGSGSSDNLTWELDDRGTLTVSGDGKMDVTFANREEIRKVVIEDGVTSVRDYAFYGCVNLKSVSFPESVETIGSCAFYDCKNLKVTVPKEIQEIGSSAFYNVKQVYATIGSDGAKALGFAWCAFRTSGGNCTLRYTVDGDEITGLMLVSVDAGTEELVIPEGVTEIGPGAFYGLENLESVTLPKSMTTINQNAFYGCKTLLSVTLTNKVTEIGADAFAYCENLTDLDLPDSVRKIGDYAFYNCTGLESITVPDKVREVGSSSFSGVQRVYARIGSTGAKALGKKGISFRIPNGKCELRYQEEDGKITGLMVTAVDADTKQLTVPEGVTGIKSSILYNAENLTSVTIPESMEKIGPDTFYRCGKLTEVTLPDSLQAIEQNAFYKCDSLAEITIPEGVTSIGDYAFAYDESLTEITLPDSVSKMGKSVFLSCGALEKAVLSEQLQEISERTFAQCGSLTDVTIPSGVTAIGDSAFASCLKLADVILPEKLTAIGESAFGSCYNLGSVTVPAGVTSIGAKAFPDVVIYAGIGTEGAKTLGKAGFSFRVPGTNCDLKYQYTEGILTGLEVVSVDDEAETLVIPDGVTAIGSHLFSYNNSIRQITIPNSVTVIGEGAFASCKSVSELTLPESVASIGGSAFEYWNGKIIFRGNLPAMAENVFYYASVIAVYPHDGTGWPAATLQEYGARWIYWQADNDVQPQDPWPKDATETLAQSRSDNRYDHNYGWNWAGTVNSYLVPEADGGFTRVEHIGNSVTVEQYTSSMQLAWKKTLPTELTIWGGFFSGTDYNFFVFGQENNEEDDQKEVVRVVRYSKNWHRIDSASAYGQHTTIPFRAGTVDMDQSGDYLYIHTSHQMYTHSDGLRHQSNMTFKLYIPGMSFSVDNTSSPGYTSHSFNQIIYIDEGNMIMVDHGDAYPRAITIGRSENDDTAPGNRSFSRVTLLNISGETGNNYTGATVGGSKPSDTRYIVTGTSVNQEDYQNSKQDNIYVVTASKSDFTDASVTFRWQTNYPEGSNVIVDNPFLVRITGTRLLLIWTERMASSSQNVLLHYVFLNENGEASSQVYTNPGMLSDVEPVVSGNAVTWYVTNGSEVVFYSLDLANPQLITVTPNHIWLGKSGWQTDAYGNWMYGGTDGYALTGRQTIDRKQYYFSQQGIMQTGWFQEDGSWYCAGASGALLCEGWAQIGDTWYYFRENGMMAAGAWISENGKYYYMGADGAMQTGWVQDNGKWYYLGGSGAMQTGWVQDNGKWYRMGADGAMMTGWVQDGEKWYFMDDKGVMQTGWVQAGGKWYYMNGNGAMQTGWIEDGEKWYYMGTGGAMATGWVQDGDKWYCMDEKGVMRTGWFEDELARRYWFDQRGVMAAGWTEINGQWELFSEYGIWLSTWTGQ